MDTIIALASGNLPAGIAIVRVSGPQCVEVLNRFIAKPIEPRKLQLRDIVDLSDGVLIDQGMVFFAPGPNSFTGEDIVEFHVHGSKAIVQRLISGLLKLKFLRLALPGEFTRRAFDNARLNLSEVEGLGDLLDAETENQRIQALARYRGGLSDTVDNWREVLIGELANIEAKLDFSDEEDVGSYDPSTTIDIIGKLEEEIKAQLSNYESGRIVREGFRVGIAGLPNVGKSSIINALTKTDRSIVTEEAGTTRDIQEVHLEIEDQLFILFDSAGIRKSDSLAEQEGVRRSLEMLDLCDLVLWISAPDVAGSEVVPDFMSPFVKVSNKNDLVYSSDVDLSVSAIGGNVDELRDLLAKYAHQYTFKGGSLLISRERDREALEKGLKSLKDAGELLKNRGHDVDFEFVAQYFRLTLFSLERMLGIVDAEKILGRLFSGFCIGK